MNHHTQQEDDAHLMRGCGSLVIAAMIVLALAAVIGMVVTKFK